MTANRTRIEAQLEADRFLAQQASREATQAAYVRNALERAAELFLAGYYAEARRFLSKSREGSK